VSLERSGSCCPLARRSSQNRYWTRFAARLATGASPIAARFEPMPHKRAGCDHHIMKTGATVAAFARPVRLRQLIGDQHHVQKQALSHLGLPRSPCRPKAESCEGRGPSGAPGPSPSRHRADLGSRESQCCLTIET
jgi:hypothetical protein